MTTTPVGRNTGGKPINLAQLQQELGMASGLGMVDQYVHAYDSEGNPSDFPDEQQAAVDSAIAAHVAMRNKTSEEYAAEFQNPETSAARKQEIRDIQNGLLPPEQVPLTQDEWDRMRGVGAGVRA